MNEIKTIEKGTVIQRQGDGAKFIFKVHSGLLRSFFIDDMGKDHVFLFVPENWVVGDLDAIGFDSPCALSIEALEPSRVEMIPLTKEGELNWDEVNHVEFMRLLRRAGSLQRRILMMMSTSALERYEYFLKTYPNLGPRLTQKHIASYLGITPQRLSKLRAERVGK